MLQNVHQLTELVKVMELDVCRSQDIIEDDAERLHQSGQRAHLTRLLNKEMVKQLVLQLAHLSGEGKYHISGLLREVHKETNIETGKHTLRVLQTLCHPSVLLFKF